MVEFLVSWLDVHLGLPRSERGASLVEYALLLSLIAIVCIAAIGFLGTETSSGISTDTSSMFTP